MDMENRIEALEQEVKTLKAEIRSTLVEIQASLPEKPVTAVKWQKKAWVLALLNILMAVVLFTNIYFYVPGLAPFEINANLAAWLRALWIAIAFIWLLLQMYPLALLLEQEDEEWQGVIWRNATAFLRARPGLLVLLTLTVLVVALINTILPAAWLIIALALLAGVGSVAVRNILGLYQK